MKVTKYTLTNGREVSVQHYGPLAEPEPNSVGFKTYQQAVADVERSGVPLRNVYVDRGYLSDYGLPDYREDGHCAHYEIDGEDSGLWVDLHGWRVFVVVDTGAGLALDDDGEIWSGDRDTIKDALQGWEYIGSAGYRVEVVFDSLPKAERESLFELSRD